MKRLSLLATLLGWLCMTPLSGLAQITNDNIHEAVALWLTNQDSALTTYGHISNWDVSAVTNMTSLFVDKPTFNDDISSWDVSNVTTMRLMFWNAFSFNQPIGDWDVSNVENFHRTFSGAASFNQDLDGWDVSNATTMYGMFEYAAAFNSSIGGWDVSNVSTMNAMFNGASSFNRPIGDWNVSNVNDISSIFKLASTFNQDLSSWDVSSVTSLRNAFYFASDFNQDISSWDVSNVTQLQGAFRSAASFNQDISSWDVANVTNFENTFLGPNALPDEKRCNIHTAWSSNEAWSAEYDWSNFCSVLGCTDDTACNYNAEANADDGSCLQLDECGVCGGAGIAEGACDCDGNLPEEYLTCEGTCLNDADGDGTCDELEVFGCTSDDACNYDAEATEDDGSCLLDLDGNGICDVDDIDGCMDPSDCNYNPEATSGGSMTVPVKATACGQVKGYIWVNIDKDAYDQNQERFIQHETVLVINGNDYLFTIAIDLDENGDCANNTMRLHVAWPWNPGGVDAFFGVAINEGDLIEVQNNPCQQSSFCAETCDNVVATTYAHSINQATDAPVDDVWNDNYIYTGLELNGGNVLYPLTGDEIVELTQDGITNHYFLNQGGSNFGSGIIYLHDVLGCGSPDCYANLSEDFPGGFRPLSIIRFIQATEDCANLGCTDPNACNFSADAILNNGSCLQLDECGVCGGGNSTCAGCMHEIACNYDATASIASSDCDYSCIPSGCFGPGVVVGCTAPDAVNFNPEATCDSGCVFEAPCPADIDQDGSVGMSDLLDVLSAFGMYCE